jgi:hypothetical protein
LAPNVTNPSFLNPFEYGNHNHLCHGFQEKCTRARIDSLPLLGIYTWLIFPRYLLLSKVWLTRFDESNAV